MRTVGCGWTQFATKWGFYGDEAKHTSQLLRRMLIEDILPYEMALRRQRKLPKEAALPQTTRKARVLKVPLRIPAKPEAFHDRHGALIVVGGEGHDFGHLKGLKRVAQGGASCL